MFLHHSVYFLRSQLPQEVVGYQYPLEKNEEANAARERKDTQHGTGGRRNTKEAGDATRERTDTQRGRGKRCATGEDGPAALVMKDT